eukprot:CAMPEP_0170796906 /NCGR_PEP_ID=MMETSP0733-20121128/25206_1 /TAXON_ID=186038 /ORGANISM="Fragilariopsis kerguelensis, Strain L26-C5" /LENGTH=36 /DNA_ID= /DNA_START= /DNA_END= /DNA_ORIENTATION=
MAVAVVVADAICVATDAVDVEATTNGGPPMVEHNLS